MAPYRKYQERCTHDEVSVDFPSAVTALLGGSIAAPSHPTSRSHHVRRRQRFASAAPSWLIIHYTLTVATLEKKTW